MNRIGNRRKRSAAGLIGRITAWLHRCAADSVAGRVLSSYDLADRLLPRSAVGRAGKALGGLRTVGRAFSRQIENSVFITAVNRIAKCLLNLRMRTWGWFFLSFGFYSLSVWALKVYGIAVEKFSAEGLFLPIVLMIISFPLLASDDALSVALLSNRLTRYVILNIMGFREHSVISEESVGGRNHIAFIIGIVLGGLSYFFTPALILCSAAVAVMLYIVLVMPEFGVLLMFFLPPFVSVKVLCSLVIAVEVSYTLKFLRGKRVLDIHLIDVFVFLFTIFVLLGCLFSPYGYGGTLGKVMTVCALLGYFVTVNLIDTPKLLHRITVAMLSSAVIAALVRLAVVAAVFVGVPESRLAELFEIAPRLISDASGLAAYLIMILPFGASFMFTSDSGRKRFRVFLLTLTVFAAVILTGAEKAWLGLAVGMLLFLIMLDGRATVAVILTGALGTAVYFSLPPRIAGRIAEWFTSAGTALASGSEVRCATLRMICDSPFSGVGYGAFTRVYPMYSAPGAEAAQDAGSLFLQMTAEYGVFGLILFLALVFVFVQSGMTYSGRAVSRREKFLTHAGLCGVISALLMGCFQQIWSDPGVYMIFWLVLGLTIAYKRKGTDNDRLAAPNLNDPGAARVDIDFRKG